MTDQMQLKTMTGLAIFVLLFGIAATPLMHYADAAYGSSNAGYATTKDTMKDKAKTATKPPVTPAATKSTETKVTIAKGASTPGCDAKKTCYTPFETKVKKGTKVTWTNGDTAAHTVTSGKKATSDGTFDSSLFGPGKTFSYTFSKAGSYDYFCMVHPWMTGKVTVS